ncbi:MAG: VOC family protein [Euryarchaeota archaeon]|nr:VOC family protein [Euryarchaeota archaeon]
MFQGLRTVIYDAEDLPKTKAWFEKVTGKKPYFDQPFYVGFNVGGFELGLDPARQKVSAGGASVAYWGVADATQAVKRLGKLGATVVEPVKEVGEGIKVATVRSPFGHVIGIIENPHFKPD